MKTSGQDLGGVGIGLRREHFETIHAHAASFDFVEVLTENALREPYAEGDGEGAWVRFGGRPHAALERAAARFPVVLHGVSLSVGRLDPIDEGFVEAVDALGDALGARWFSDHLCWSAAHGTELHELLPLPFTAEAVAHVAAQVARVKARSRRPFLLENPTYYLDARHAHDREMDEAAFLRAVLERADCGLLLDVNNVYVNAHNHGYDARRFIDALPLERVMQIHLAGHVASEVVAADGARETVLIDTHSRPIRDEVMALYAHVIARTGKVATLVEWDHEVPAIEVMAAEAERVRAVMERAG